MDKEGQPLQPAHVLTLSLADEHRLFQADQEKGGWGEMDSWLQRFPSTWAETGGIGLAKHLSPVVVQLKAVALPIRVWQYPMPEEARKGIAPHIHRLLETGILKTCQSAWNTPLLPVRKPGSGDYRPVQDLRKVNERVEDIHPTVPNPYTLLSYLPPAHVWYTTLDLKDAFFSIPLSEVSQPLFAFEWQEPGGGRKGQLTWTRLPQGFKNSPTLFNEALSQDLEPFRRSHPRVTLLQYVDDLLLATETREECEEATGNLLAELGELGYRASAKKAHICQRSVVYLGYEISNGARWLTQAMKQTILTIPVPSSPRGVREFLGSAGFCRLWIPGYAEIARPLYEATKEGPGWQWTQERQEAFDRLKEALLRAPALSLPDPEKPFILFIDEKKGVAKGVLAQQLGPWKRPVAYLSKRLDPVASGWPPCLRILAAIALLVKEADKLTFGQNLRITAPHTVEGILRHPPGKWMTNARLTHYQGLLLDSPRIAFSDPVTLNPATLLPDPDPTTPIHDCGDILSEIIQVRADLKDTPLPSCELNWYTDGSSFVQEGVRRAGAAVVTHEGEVVWSAALPPGTSAQKAELIALAEALERAEGKRANIYTDSRYAFGTVHVHGAIYRERGFRSAEGKGLRNLQEVQRLLAAVEKPKAVAVIHVPGHQSKKTPEAVGNSHADAEAKRAALSDSLVLAALEIPIPELPALPPKPEYSPQDLEWIKKQVSGKVFREGNWSRDQEGRLILPEALGQYMLANLHKSTHLGWKKLLSLFQSAQLVFPHQNEAARQITNECSSCARLRPAPRGLHPAAPPLLSRLTVSLLGCTTPTFGRSCLIRIQGPARRSGRCSSIL
nr:uncharacterized protein LOC118971162 [Manis javanica]